MLLFPWIHFIYFSRSKCVSGTSFVQNTGLTTLPSSEMSHLGLLFFQRGSASASVTWRVPPAASANRCTGTWPQRTPADVQVTFLTHNDSLRGSLLVTVCLSDYTQQELLFNQFRLSGSLYQCFDVSPWLLAELCHFHSLCQGRCSHKPVWLGKVGP